MEDEVMEQIKSRLAAATSAATELAKSLDALDENTLQTLEVWLAKQEGELKCAKCRALMPRGRETSVCIACGCKRPPLPNTPAYDFKVSFAFLQFLETIHPPLQVGVPVTEILMDFTPIRWQLVCGFEMPSFPF